MTSTMERMLERRHKLTKSTAREVVAEARQNLSIDKKVLFSEQLEKECMTISQKKGLIRKKLSSTAEANRNELEFLSSKREKFDAVQAQTWTRFPSKLSKQSLLSALKENRRVKSDTPSCLKDAQKPADLVLRSPSFKPKQRFKMIDSGMKSADPIVPKVGLTTIEENRSSHGGVTVTRREGSEGESNKLRWTKPYSKTDHEPEGEALKDFLANMIGDCKVRLIQDNFRPLLFDSSGTNATDGESVSSSNSGWTWGSSSSITSRTSSECKNRELGVRQLALRFETGRAANGRAPKQPIRQLSFDDDDHLPPSPPVAVVNTTWPPQRGTR